MAMTNDVANMWLWADMDPAMVDDLAVGKNVWGDPLSDRFAPKEGETEEEYLTRLEESDGPIKGAGTELAQKIRLKMRQDPDGWKKHQQSVGFYVDPKAKAAADKEAKENTDQDKRRADMDAFYQEMMKPLDMNDPQVQRVMANVKGQAGDKQFMESGGMEGGLANTQVARAMTDTQAAIQMDRQRLGLEALGAATNSGDNLMRFREDQYRHDQGVNYQNMMSKYQNKLGQGQSIGALLGGGLGAIGGFAVGGPMGAVAGAGAGSQLGGGLGGMTAGAPPSAPTRYGYGGGGGYNRGGV